MQQRCTYLSVRCCTGFSKKDKGKKNPIPEEKALAEWQELLEKRFPQPVSGGRAFVLKIAKVVKDKKTQEGLDLTGKDAILEHLAKWCERKCKEHSIDPGSEAMQALLQQAHWHEENKEDHARTRGAVEKAAKDQKLVGSCSGEVSSRSQAAAQEQKWLRSEAGKPKGTPERAPPSIALEDARPFAAKGSSRGSGSKTIAG